jgi:hypothetical protein
MRKLSKMLNQVGDRPGTLGFVSQKDVEKLEVATFLSIENKTDLQSLTVKDVSAILITDNSILESYSPPPSLVIGLDLREQNEISNKSQYEEIDFVLVRLSSNWQALDRRNKRYHRAHSTTTRQTSSSIRRNFVIWQPL